MSTEAKLRAQHERDDYPDPTECDLKDPAFNAVWEAIKGWDLSREPMAHRLYAGATGNDVMHILTALRAVEQACAVPDPAVVAPGPTGGGEAEEVPCDSWHLQLIPAEPDAESRGGRER